MGFGWVLGLSGFRRFGEFRGGGVSFRCFRRLGGLGVWEFRGLGGFRGFRVQPLGGHSGLVMVGGWGEFRVKG